MTSIQSFQNIGRYRNLVPVGAGSFATVYKAVDSLLQRSVALKVLAPNIALDDEFVQEFISEAQKAAAIDHKNVVRVYDVGEETGQFYIALEFLESSLDKLISKSGPLPLQTACKLLVDIASGLHAAHSQVPTLVHYDVKPHNILLDAAGNAKVGDFGIAESASATRGTARGTPKYIAPEVATLSKTGSDQRADVYSLGVVFFEMLTGRLPFEGNTEFEVTRQHVEAAPPDPREYISDLPEWVSKVILKCLEKDPDDRYTSMLSLVDAVAANVPTLESAAAATATIELVAYRAPRRALFDQIRELVVKNRMATSAITAAFIATIALLATVLSSPDTSDSQIRDSNSLVQVPVQVVTSGDVSAPIASNQLTDSPVVAQALVEGETQINELRILKTLDEQELTAMAFVVSEAENSVVAELPRMLNVIVDSFLQIDLQQVADPHLTESTVTFEVDRNWIDQFELTEGNVRLYRFADNGWWELNTIVVSSSPELVEYEALTPGFSIFAVGSPVSDDKAAALGEAMDWPEVERSSDSSDQPQRVVSVLQVPEQTSEPELTEQRTPTPAAATPQPASFATPTRISVTPTVSPTATSIPSPTVLPILVPTPTIPPVPTPVTTPPLSTPTPIAVTIPTATSTPIPVIVAPTSTPTPIATTPPTSTVVSTSTPSPTVEVEPTETPVDPTNTPVVDTTSEPTVTATPEPTAAPFPTPTVTPTPTPTATPTPTVTPTPTPLPTATPVPLEINLGVSSPTYLHADLAEITYQVNIGSAPIAGVFAILVVNEPNSGTQQANIITDINGSGGYSFRLNKNKGGCGIYTITVTTTFNGNQTIDVITFELLCN
ncbi:protein kinase [Dehalococcoides mccartyi]|nr:protein kinase [Dehalococcoides mccartyi]